MKIGILTHHYVKNFGATLQATALINTIKDFQPDSQVEVINFVLKKHAIKTSMRFFRFKISRDTLVSYIEKLKLLNSHLLEEKRLPLGEKVMSSEDIKKQGYDLIVVGSDEVWNFGDIAYSPEKFGFGLDDVPLISYAASTGDSNINMQIPFEIKAGLNNFDSISVRDENSVTLISNLKKDVNVLKVLDPVFIYDFQVDVNDDFKNKVGENFILIYDCRLNDFTISSIIKFAKKNKLKIIGAGEYRKWYTEMTVNINMEEWLYLFQKAAYVITGTFHGVSFSIKYGRKFVAYATEKNRIDKISSLLSDFKLSDRLVLEQNEKKVMTTLVTDIDYERVNLLLNNKIKLSIGYLRDNMLLFRRE